MMLKLYSGNDNKTTFDLQLCFETYFQVTCIFLALEHLGCWCCCPKCVFLELKWMIIMTLMASNTTEKYHNIYDVKTILRQWLKRQHFNFNYVLKPISNNSVFYLFSYGIGSCLKCVFLELKWMIIMALPWQNMVLALLGSLVKLSVTDFTVCWSEGSLYRRIIVPKGHCSRIQTQTLFFGVMTPLSNDPYVLFGVMTLWINDPSGQWK